MHTCCRESRRHAVNSELRSRKKKLVKQLLLFQAHLAQQAATAAASKASKLPQPVAKATLAQAQAGKQQQPVVAHANGRKRTRHA